MSEKRIRLSEAARRIGVSVWTLRRWAYQGVVTFYLVGPGHYMEFDPTDIEALDASFKRDRHTPPVS